MNNRIIIINLLLIIVVVFEIFMIFQMGSSETALSKDEKKGPVNPEKFEAVRLYQKNNTPLSAYDAITRDNLFAPDRKEFIPKAVDPESKPESEPEPVPITLDTGKITLFGVIVMDDIQKALVSDVDKSGKGASIWIEKGDVIDGFTVKSIEKDRVIVSQKGKDFVVLLYDEKKPKQREPIDREPVQKIISNEKKIIPPPQPEKVTIPSVSPGKEEGEQEIISTPFGDFKRNKE